MIEKWLTGTLAPYLLAGVGTIIITLVSAAATQTVRLERKNTELTQCQAAITAAQSSGKVRAAGTGLEAVTNYVTKQTEDGPVIERVVTRVHNVCVRQPADRDLSVPAAASVSGLPGREAQDQADREFAQAIADDLAACSGELNRLDAIREFHNANVGDAR